MADALNRESNLDPAEENRRLCLKAAECWFITGATAGGKTDVGLKLAESIDAEIISLDSMAIYRGMNIGTAKPTAEQQSRVPHHMIDIRDPLDSFSVSEFRDLAFECIAEIGSRDKKVIFVGGTALYLKSLLRGLFDGPPADWEFRKQIEAELADVDSELLHERLAVVDPVSSHKLHPNDRRRIIRALEVYKLTGKAISHWQMQSETINAPESCKVFTLRHARPILHKRIENRVDQMFENGMVDEVRSLLDQWNDLGHTASQAVGYREVIDYIRDGNDLVDTIEKVRIRTRRFARHQETWFRGLDECRMIDLPADFNEDETAQHLLELGNQVDQAIE